MKQRALVLFDFDGTLTKGDTLLPFLWFSLPLATFLKAGLTFSLHGLRLLFTGNWNNERLKEALFSACFKGLQVSEVHALGVAFSEKKLPALLRADTMGRMKEHLRQGDTVVIVSASADIWLRPFAEQWGVELICTRLEVLEGRFTGRLAGYNCNGQEKSRRIKGQFHLEEFNQVLAYGNTKGDYAMFELADVVWWAEPGKLTRIRG